MNKITEVRQISSLSKVFPNVIYGKETKGRSCIKGQSLSYQITIMGSGEFSFELKSDLSEYTKIFRVGYVPSELSAYPDRHDDDYITADAGIFPDPLFPKEDNNISLSGGEYYTLWISINIPSDISAGEYSVLFSLCDGEKKVSKKTFTVKIGDAVLPKQTLVFTQWFHTDCIADVHGVEVFSEEHWSLIEKYMRLAAEHGMNTILTPLFTPPLDTEVGGERTTVQLIDVFKNGGTYTFGTEKLKRFIGIAKACGIKYFELSHFFTQWGAYATPKIVAEADGERKKIFGWEVEARDPEYARFLSLFVPTVLDTFSLCGVERERIYVHVSDEPHSDHLESYKAAHDILMPLVKGCRHIDALSHFEFLKEGLVEIPVAATSALEPFIEAKIENMWCYYCCSQSKLLANRFFAMPSRRNRIIGVQMFKFGMKGFLHWGYNFYNSQYSKRKIDPYTTTDAGCAFPSGDAFSVYPYRDGVIPSLRIKVFSEALEDMRVLELLAEKIGKDSAVALLDRAAGCDITFTEYPREDGFFDRLYEAIFELI